MKNPVKKNMDKIHKPKTTPNKKKALNKKSTRKTNYIAGTRG
jgi:hypothetical protein